MAELAAQLMRGPKRLRLRQLGGIEFLLSVLEPAKQYPTEFIVHGLTGYRPRSSADGDARMLTGKPVREDLVLLAEELSADADMPIARWGGMVCTVAELAERFDVSTKTIFRWHRRGLIGWRMRFADRRFRLAFHERCVRRFVAGNAALVNRGSSFTQLTEAERDAIINRAEQLVESGEKTVNAVAKVLSTEGGRAVETIRLILKAYDDARPKAGIFNRSALQVPADDRRLKIWEAHLDGASVKSLAARFEIASADVYAIINEMRARDIRSRPIEFIPSDEFVVPGAEELALRDPNLNLDSQDQEQPRIPPGLPPYLKHLFRVPLLTKQQEVALFRKMNYLRYKADTLRDQIEPATATAKQLDEIERLVDEATAVKNQITQANLRLVVSIAKRHARPTHDFFELVSDGNISLMRAVDKFDYSRGFKFSTYSSWAIIKNFARSVPEQRVHQDRYQTGRDELLEKCVGVTPEEYEGDFLPAARSVLDRMLDTLDGRDAAILRQRHGLDNQGRSQTLEQVGKSFGVSKERIRQLESRAMNKLRDEFGEEVKSLVGPD
jgi:RNA polymerase sigma factor (sigma-70 family)